MSGLNFIFMNGRGSSGKDTQADKLLNLIPSAIRISTGDIYRDARDRKGRYGQYHESIKHYIESVEKGNLLPDSLITGIVADVVDKERGSGFDTFIFTGFPRTIPQLRTVDEWLGRLRTEGSTVGETFICFAVLESISRKRAENRRLEGRITRKDDEEEVVENRLRVYREQIKPMLRKLLDEGRLEIIKSNGSIENVHERTLRTLGLEGVTNFSRGIERQ